MTRNSLESIFEKQNELHRLHTTLAGLKGILTLIEEYSETPFDECGFSAYETYNSMTVLIYSMMKFFQGGNHGA